MTRHRNPILALVLLGASAFASVPASTAATAPASAAFVPDQLIVGFHPGPTAAARRALHESLGARTSTPIEHAEGMDLVTFEAGADLDALERAYLVRGEVAFAHRNWIGEGGGGVVPDDTWYPAQWQWHNTGQSGGTPGADIEAEAGWALSTGSPAIVAAVLDSGIDSDHPEFAGRILPGWDYVNNDADPEDDHSHGTYVAGLLAANANNAFAVSGVDRHCMILPVKVLNAANSGTTANLISGIGFASAQGADVISMSLINYPCSSGLQTAMNNAKLAGAILVACAGNGGIGNADVSCPGASTHTLSIGASDDNDWRASYSGTGAALEFMAPGDLAVTVAYGTSADTYQLFNGCSSATPIAAGIVTILRGVAESLGVDLRTSDVRAVLRASAVDQVGNPAEDTPGWDAYMGWGRLSLRAVLEEFLAVTAAPAAAPDAGPDLVVSPNPARRDVSLRFSLAAAGWAKVAIFDVAGRRLRTLADGPRPAGAHDVTWDGAVADGAPAAPGVYFARVEAGGRSVLRKVTLVR